MNLFLRDIYFLISDFIARRNAADLNWPTCKSAFIQYGKKNSNWEKENEEKLSDWKKLSKRILHSGGLYTHLVYICSRDGSTRIRHVINLQKQ